MKKNIAQNLTKALGRLFLLMVILGLLLFLSAGTLRWPQAWILIIMLTLFFLLYLYWALFKDPAQTQERSQVSKNVKHWDKVIISIYSILLPTIFIVAGLDVGRFKLITVPLFVLLPGWVGLLIAPGIIFWTITTNTYLSRFARIQDDRNQEVIVSGPYRFIRHPMYFGIIILFLCLGPALGSFFALIPGLMIDALFIIRTAKEDKMLLDELPGYLDYSHKVHYRLIPGVW